MKRTNRWLRIGMAILCLAIALSLVSCLEDMDVGDNGELAVEFMTHVMNDDADAAYEMVKSTVGRTEFFKFWADLQMLAAGSEECDIEQTGWNVNTTNGVTTYTTEYLLEFDNDCTVQLQVVTQDNVEGIAGIHFTDLTEFEEKSESTLPVIRIIMGIVSLAAFAFTVWMFVDCLRKKLKYKVLWAILIFVGVAWTVTFGETFGYRVMIGVMLQPSTVTANLSSMAYSVKLVVPLGAIIYLAMRKRYVILPEEPTEEQNTVEPQVIFDSCEETKESEPVESAEPQTPESTPEENGEEPKN